MNLLHDNILNTANEAAVYNLYLYLAHITSPCENATLMSIVSELEQNFKNPIAYTWKSRDIYRLNILINAVKNDDFIAKSKIRNLTVSKSGLTACSFTNQNKCIFVVFKGTGKGEWIDNGEGLSGIPEENTYVYYGEKGVKKYSKTVNRDYATDQQVEALNWYNGIASKEGWTKADEIILTGHSKGGNKAQFITIYSDLVNGCYSFDGQGFSPEAYDSFKKQFGINFDIRRQKIHSLSTDNDYINVLGVRLMPQNQIYFFESWIGIHFLEAMLNTNGKINRQCEQGRLSSYIETVSEKLMDMEPNIRKYAALGVMNIIQKFIGEGTPVNGDKVSVEQTVIGLGIAIEILFKQLRESK